MAGRRPTYVLVGEASFAEFEWHEEKRALNWDTHEVDFEDAKLIFQQPHVLAPSNRRAEARWMAVGLLDGVEITVVFTMREETCRIISARRARHYERKTYHEAIDRRSKTRQN